MAHGLVFPGAIIIGLMGPPGAGKGTQAQLLVDEFGFKHLSTGDVLRAAIAADTAIGRQAAELINAGHLVPDGVINHLVDDWLAEALERGQKLLLDGYPRTLPQLAYLRERLMHFSGAKAFGVFFLDVPLEKLADRLEGRRVCANCGTVFNIHYLPPEKPGHCDLCGGELVQRPDDARDSVRERLETYNRETCPVLDALQARGVLHRIPAEGSHEVVHSELVRELRSLIGSVEKTVEL